MDAGSGFAGGVLPALAPNRSRRRDKAARPGFDHLAWPLPIPRAPIARERQRGLLAWMINQRVGTRRLTGRPPQEGLTCIGSDGSPRPRALAHWATLKSTSAGIPPGTSIPKYLSKNTPTKKPKTVSFTPPKSAVIQQAEMSSPQALFSHPLKCIPDHV